jgi:hypothetical protein
VISENCQCFSGKQAEKNNLPLLRKSFPRMGSYGLASKDAKACCASTVNHELKAQHSKDFMASAERFGCQAA